MFKVLDRVCVLVVVGDNVVSRISKIEFVVYIVVGSDKVGE